MDREWTDKRTDDLADRVGRFEGNVDRRFDAVDRRFDAVDRRFDRLESKINLTNRTIWGGIVAAAVVKFLFG